MHHRTIDGKWHFVLLFILQEGQCSLVQGTKDSCSDLFHSMFHAPSKIEKERARELKSDFADLERVAFVNANSLRAHAFLHVKQNQITLNGYVNVLVSFPLLI